MCCLCDGRNVQWHVHALPAFRAYRCAKHACLRNINKSQNARAQQLLELGITTQCVVHVPRQGCCANAVLSLFKLGRHASPCCGQIDESLCCQEAH